MLQFSFVCCNPW